MVVAVVAQFLNIVSAKIERLKTHKRKSIRFPKLSVNFL